MSVLKTENLTKVYKRGWKEAKTALDSLSIEVHEGEVFGFLGPNGAGKTTTIKILLRLLTPTAGSAQILGQDLRNAPTRLRVGYMPENPYFYRFLSGEELLHFYGKLCHFPVGMRRERSRELLNLVGLEHAAHVRVGEYSKGMVQRVGLAQALLNEPELILMDEPMSGLDPIGRAEMQEVIKRLRQAGKTVFFCSHILSDVEELCERIAILHRGRMVVAGKVNQLLESEERRIFARVSGVSLPPPLEARVLRRETVGEELHLFLADTAAADDLVRHVAASGGRLLSLESRRMNLEEFFMKKIAEAQKEAAA